jgi:hypothetical protein
MPYTTAAEVRRRALVKWDSLNYSTSPPAPFADETAFDNWLTNTVIPETEKLINDYCRRPDFSEHAEEVEYFDSDGFHSFLVLSNKPVIAVSKLEFEKDDATWDERPSSYYRVHGDRVVYRTLLPEGFQNIRVTYSWGFAEVPADVSYVAAEMAARFVQKRVVYKMGPLVRVEDFRVELANPDVFTDDLKATLDHYRRDVATIV